MSGVPQSSNTTRPRRASTVIFNDYATNAEPEQSLRRSKRRGSNDFLAMVQQVQQEVLQQNGEHSPWIFGTSILIVVVWSVLCALAAAILRDEAKLDKGGLAELWLENFKDCRYGISAIGSLFVFTVVFRFNACYDRWWESRVLWGSIISKTLELGTMNASWIADEELANKVNRFLVLFSYTSKSLLRGKSIGDDGEDGPALIKRKLLTQEELNDMQDNPSWQPYYIIHMLRILIVEAHQVPGALCFDENSKIRGQLWRSIDNSLKDLTVYVGDCIRLRTSGLPATYDAIVMVSYFTFFALASIVWSAHTGWLAPIIVFAASGVIMFLIIMGTNMVDPFGYDKVDIPMDAFCRTIELQIHAIDERRNTIGTTDRLAIQQNM